MLGTQAPPSGKLDSRCEPLLYSLLTMPPNYSSSREGSPLERFRQLNPYQQAAVVYLVYGLVYLGGASYLASIGRATRGSPVLWLAVGSIFEVGEAGVLWGWQRPRPAGPTSVAQHHLAAVRAGRP